MSQKNRSRRSAFSLLELMLVVVIIGLIAAIAIPRMSRGAAGASDSALSGNVAVLRDAIDRYAAEHGGSYPTAANFANQLTLFSSATGATQATKDTTYVYGPYIRAIPTLPVGAKKGNAGVAAADGANVGWIYVESTGVVNANCADTEVDATGKKYNTY